MNKLYRYPALILLVCALVTVFFAFQLPRLELDNNNFRFISPDDPARLVSSKIDDTFGSSVFILVALRRRYGDVFDAAFLRKIRDYVEKIEAIEIIEPVTSMVTADYISGDNESIRVEKLLPGDFSGTEEEIAALKEKLLSWDMYKNSLVSDDFSATQILVPMNVSSDEAGLPETVDSFIRVRDIALEMFAGSADVYVTGIPVISATINEAMRADLVVLIPVVILVVLLVLFFSFRNLGGVILPLITVIIAAVWSVGAIPVFGIKLSVVSTVLPVILVAVGSAYGIHVFAHYLDARSSGAGEPDRETHRALVIALVRNIARPVFLAALTTFAGFLSFCFTTVLPIREFGFFSCFGVLAAFVIAITIIPALILLRGPVSVPAVTRREGSGIAAFFSALALRKEAVLCVSAVLIIVSAFGASRLVIDNVFIEYFRSDTGIYQSDVFVRETFGGSKIISVVAEASSSERLLSPDSLLAMDNMASYLERHVPAVGKVMGFTDLVKRVNQVFNAGESPEGVAAKTSAVSAENGEPAFGFDGAFGFDDESSAADFGFDAHGADTGDFGFYDIAADFEKDEAPPASAVPETGRTGNDLIALISRAARSASVANPGTEELVAALEKLVNYEGASYYEIPANPARYGKTAPAELAGIVSNY
ncbi:MAG: MMPL family transporter, partial [Treponema sp.]|nr:MMPL family transporter [Treponema sp.]